MSDEERREVAERLRSVAREVDRGGFSETIKHVKLAVFEDLDRYRPNGTLDRLADLIDPGESGQNQDTNPDTVQKESPAVQKATSCDREALLELADDMACLAAMATVMDDSTSAKMLAEMLRDIARRIREACGEVVR